VIMRRTSEKLAVLPAKPCACCGRLFRYADPAHRRCRRCVALGRMSKMFRLAHKADAMAREAE